MKNEPEAEARHIELSFDDNRLLSLLYGEHNANLAHIEQQMGVIIETHGNVISVGGPPGAVETVRTTLHQLWKRLQKGLYVGEGDIDAALRMSAIDAPMRDMAINALSNETKFVKTRNKTITARSPMQALYLESMQKHELVFATGPAGTGKTYLAVAHGVSLFLAGKYEKLIFSRPAVEAGERLGFLPGDLRDKIDPYLRPIYDALYEMMPSEQVVKRLSMGQIEIAPLAFMRGRTLSNAFIVLDEAQNTTSVQMKMALTRLGEGSRMVVTGDITQVDLPKGVHSGLREAVDLLEGTEGIDVIRFTENEVVRHNLVSRIVKAYNSLDRSRGTEELYKTHLPGEPPAH